MDDNRGGLEVLTDKQCWNLLGRQQLGRLVTNVDRALDIFPVNYVVDDRSIVFRTAEGTKLFTAIMNSQVLFEADDHNVVEGWSVIVRGTAEVLYGAEDIQDAERAGLYPWIATLKLRFVRVTPTQITGRRFVFGPEPDGGAVPG